MRIFRPWLYQADQAGKAGSGCSRSRYHHRKAGGGYEAVTGTSFAAPFVTGSAALLMQWGIVDGNDPFLYGEKVKAYLIRGARHLPGYTEWPNERVGYGEDVIIRLH